MSTDKRAVVVAVEAWVRRMLDERSETAHGWLHIDRVRRNILALTRAEGMDPFLAELAALLHDVGRTQPGPESEHGARSEALIAPFLAELPLAEEEREAIRFAVRWHNSGRADSQLLCILRDADMLDGMGAIGIMRAFMSRSHLPPYDADAPFEMGGKRGPALYCSDQLDGQMAWYDWLNTETARQMADDRIALMRAFVVQARNEIGIGPASPSAEAVMLDTDH